MTHPFIRRLCGIGALVALLLSPSPLVGQRGTTARPRLVVVLVVDQMRADYVDRFQRDWSGGLKRIFTKGARFTSAAYPYLATYTCAGHATIATGAFPHVHGIFQNAWYDRERGGNMTCTDDPTVQPVPYGAHANADGPARLRVPTLADALRAQRSSRVVSLAIKARSAIMLAGHGGDLVSWMPEEDDGWQTSTAFSPAPVAAMKAYVSANRLEADYGKVWTRTLPPARYPEVDDEETEAPRPGWTTTFPHPLLDPSGAPGKQFYDLWQHSPFADEYVGRMAASLAETLELGQRGTTDVLAISFSSPDLVGHQYGPNSQEIRDMYVRLDGTIGRLLKRLDDRLGRDGYVVGLSADHGVTEIPEQQIRHGQSAGRLTSRSVNDLVQRTVEQAFGPGQYAARVTTNDVYFSPGVYDRLRQQPAALEAVERALTNEPGIVRVLRGEQLDGATQSADPVVRAAALSYVPGRSGDLILVTRPGWMFSTAGTTHGSATAADQRVPLAFMGWGIRPGTYAGAATPADLAPTLAMLAGVSLPTAEGRALTVALRAAAASRQGQGATP